MYKFYIEVDGEIMSSSSSYKDAGDAYRMLKRELMPGQFIALIGRDLERPADVPLYYRHDWAQRQPWNT